MPTWTEAADWLEANVQTSLSEDRDRETAWDQARDECIQALRSKAAFDQRVEELRAAGTTLRRVITYEPERVRVQFIRDGVVQMEAAFGVVPEPPANASPLERARLIKEGWASWHAQCDFNAKSHKLPDRVHYVDRLRTARFTADGRYDGESTLCLVDEVLHSLRKACFDPEATRVIRKRRPGDRAPMPLPADARLLAPQEHLRERGDLAGVDDYWYACGSSQRDQTVEAFLANRPGLQVVRAIRRVGVDPDFRWIDQDELYNVKTDRFVGDVDQLLGEARSEPIDSRARFDWPIKGTGWARRVDAAGDIAWCCGLYERDRTEGVRCQRCGWPPSRHVGIRTAIFDLRGATPVRGVVVQLAFGRERLFTYEAAGRLVEGNMANFDHQNPWYRLATDNIDAGVVALNILPPPPVPDLHAAHRAKLARYRPGLLTQLQNVSDKVPRGPLWDELHDLVLQLGKVLPHAPPFIDRPPVEGGMTARLHDVPGVPPKPKPLEPRVDNMGSPWPEDDL